MKRWLWGRLVPTSRGMRAGIVLVLVGGALITSATLVLALRPAAPPAGGGAPGGDAADRARLAPLEIRPRAEPLLAVSPAQDQWLREQIQPPQKRKLTSSYCLHLLRVHGLHEPLHHPDFSSGEVVLRLLTDDQFGAAHFGNPAVVRTRSGVRFPTADVEAAGDPSREFHRDHTLAAFAELGLPLSYPLHLQGREAPLREALRDSLANFYPKQKELPWTALAYALYLPPEREWVNRYGERSSFDELTGELLGTSLEEASCGGTHLLYTLTILARVDQQTPILSEPVRDRLWAHLRRAVDVAVRSQQPDGSWPAGWYRELLPGSAPALGTAPEGADRLLITGHLAEWLLYLPPDLAAPPEVLRRAGLWLQQRLSAASPEDKELLFCPYSHAACVLRRLTYVPGESRPGS
jgi:hypothetical protein